jgi:hypothetical protein
MQRRSGAMEAAALAENNELAQLTQVQPILL